MATFNNVNDYTYTRLFRDFVNFAQERVNAGKEEAIAILKGQQSLGGRKMIAVTRSLTDEVHKWTRTTEEKGDNDATRTFFRQAIANMFGGESKIPESVKKAMRLSDYGYGKPLTARRIMAVKRATRPARCSRSTAPSPTATTTRVLTAK